MIVAFNEVIAQFGHWQFCRYSRYEINSYYLRYKPNKGSNEYVLIGKEALSITINPRKFINFYSILCQAPSQSAMIMGDDQIFVDFKKADSHREELFFRVPFSMDEAEKMVSFKKLELRFYDVSPYEKPDQILSYPFLNNGLKEVLEVFTKLVPE